MTSTAGAFSTLTVELTDGIGRLTLNQPDQLNPLGSNTLAEIAQHAERCRSLLSAPPARRKA